MTAEEARMAGIEESDFWQYSRDVDSKDNLAPPSANSNWRRMVSVDLANSDSVGVIEPWQWPDVFDDVTVNDLGWRRARSARWWQVSRRRALPRVGRTACGESAGPRCYR